MEQERGAASVDQRVHRKDRYKNLFLLTYQSLGVVYADLSTSPLYVYKGAFPGKLYHHQDEEIIFGLFSLIFWTFTLIPLLKYVFIVLNADDNGEGGTFALYSLLCRHAKFSLLPNQQVSDEELLTYYGSLHRIPADSPLKRFTEKLKNLRTVLLLIVLLSASMVIGDAVLLPAISVLSSVSGLQVRAGEMKDGLMVTVACIVLVGLFSLQHKGTQKVAFLFAPIITVWLLCLGVIGLYNTIHWNPKIYQALSPYYVAKFFKKTGKDGWISLSGTVLSISGTEAMIGCVGYFTGTSIRLAFVSVVYPCLVLQYMGQAAFLSKNMSDLPTSFYKSIPEPFFWPVLLAATLASIVATQAVMSVTFSIVKQCHALACFPRVKIVHTSRWMRGQVYIPEINWILMLLCLAVTIGFHDTTVIGHAYGITSMTIMFVATLMMTLVIIFIWQKNVVFALLFLIFFGCIETAHLSASLIKVPQGGWVPLVLAFVSMLVMYVWHYGTRRKHLFELQNKVPMKWILTLGPNFGVVRVPGIGLVYTDLAMGVPAIFSHFVANLPALPQVVAFICVKIVQVPRIPPEERYLVGRLGPRAYRMYKCIIRYGYKDMQKQEDNSEDLLVASIAKFIQMEAEEISQGVDDANPEARMAMINTCETSYASLVMRDADQCAGDSTTIMSSKSEILRNLQKLYEQELPSMSYKRRVRFELPKVECAHREVEEELRSLVEAKHAGVTYFMGHSYVCARRTSSFLKKFVIDVLFFFLRKNCRGPLVTLSIPHISLIEVGMIYYV